MLKAPGGVFARPRRMCTGKKNAKLKIQTSATARGRAFFGAATPVRARRQGFREWGGNSNPKRNLSLSVLPPPPLAVVDVVVVAITDAAVAIADIAAIAAAAVAVDVAARGGSRTCRTCQQGPSNRTNLIGLSVTDSQVSWYDLKNLPEASNRTKLPDCRPRKHSRRSQNGGSQHGLGRRIRVRIRYGS